jgi:hypothetical protein
MVNDMVSSLLAGEPSFQSRGIWSRGLNTRTGHLLRPDNDNNDDDDELVEGSRGADAWRFEALVIVASSVAVTIAT